MVDRKVDTQGEVADAPLAPTGDDTPVGPLLIEIPLWKFGRVKLESYNSKSSLAVFALLLLVGLIAVLAIIEAFPGEHAGLASIMDKVGEALLLVLGVLLGSFGGKSKE